MKKSICDECGKKYYISEQFTQVEGYCPKCVETFESYNDKSHKVKKFHHLNRTEIKDIFETVFNSVSKYRDETVTQWLKQTLEKRLTPEGRDMGTHIDNMNNILDVIERFLNCEPKTKKL